MNAISQFDQERFCKRAALLGVLIIAIFATIQAVHFHADGQSDIHCSICLAVHATPAIIGLPSLVLLLTVQARLFPAAPILAYIPHFRFVFIRPPPITA